MIIMIRGTSGSGKSWVMREVMRSLGEWNTEPVDARRPRLYWRDDPAAGRVVVLGPYVSACGGCDAVGSARAVYDLWEEVRAGNGDVHVLMEGLLLSEDSKWTTKMAELTRVSVVFLTTPPARCLDQIRSRRAAAGNDKPLNELNTTRRVGVIERSRVKLTAAGIDCRRCPAGMAPRLVVRLLRGEA